MGSLVFAAGQTAATLTLNSNVTTTDASSLKARSCLPAACLPSSSCLPCSNCLPADSKRRRVIARRTAPLLSRFVTRSLHSRFFGRRSVSVQACTSASVVVTREKGKNKKLIDLLHMHGISSLELPLIEHKEGSDLKKLPSVIQENNFDWIVITSPEAASVFLDGWRLAGSPEARLAVVGAGTRQVLENAEVKSTKLSIEFTPSKANAKSLAEELPSLSKIGGKILYPASAKASNELQTGLGARGYEVIRLDTYSTETVKIIDPSILPLAISAPVVALASPTAVGAWMTLIDLSTWMGAAACIGQTSAVAAQKAGLKRVFYPQNPGIDGWVHSIIEALQSQCSEPQHK